MKCSSIPTASTWAIISCSRSLACGVGPGSLQLRNQIASIECFLEELQRFTHAMVVQSRPLRGDDRDHIISIFGATAQNLHRDHVFGGCDGNRGSAQVPGLRPRAEQLFNARAANHDVGVDARRKMNERKDASISDEVCVSPTQFETVRFDALL